MKRTYRGQYLRTHIGLYLRTNRGQYLRTNKVIEVNMVIFKNDNRVVLYGRICFIKYVWTQIMYFYSRSLTITSLEAIDVLEAEMLIVVIVCQCKRIWGNFSICKNLKCLVIF